mgnify:CR=1 FL=1
MLAYETPSASAPASISARTPTCHLQEDFGELLGTAESVSITLELLLSEFPEAYAGAAPAGAGAGAGGMEAAGAQAEGQQQAAGRTSDASAALEAAQQSVDAAAQRLQDTLSRQAHAARTGVATS